METAEPAQATPAAPTEAKPDRRSITSAKNGLKGGAPKHLKCNTPEDTEALVESAATAILAGRNVIKMGARTGPPNALDRDAIAKLAGIPADEFVARITAKMHTLADKTAARIEDKLDSDAYKPEGLSFLLAVLIQRISGLESRQQPANAVNIQINNYGAAGMRKEIMASLVAPDSSPEPV